MRSKITKQIKFFWSSPTFMTWGSFFSKAISLVVVLPLILTRLSTEEITLWYLFMTIISFQLLADFGFVPTFSRVIAYAMGGADFDELKRPQKKNNGQPSWKTIEVICSTMRTIYFRLGFIWMTSLILFGTISLIKPISQVHNSVSAWVAWVIVLAVSIIALQGNIYSAYLQGINQIALLRRWEAITALAVIATSVVALLSGGGLLALVIVNQGWKFLSVLWNRWLSYNVEEGRFKYFSKTEHNRKVFDAVWPSAWRSGVGHSMTYGLIQASGVLYAQVGTAASIASYLLTLRLIQTVSQFSQAPFYSKLPTFARLFAEDKKKELVLRAKRGMMLSYWCYVICFIGLGITGDPMLKFIGSNADFPTSLLWALMGLAFFVERYGAMHLQLYSITNHIIWHVANGIAGIIYILVSLLLFKKIDVYTFPVGLIVGYAGFYAWYSAMHSYKEYNLSFMKFEINTVVMPLGVMLFFFISRLCFV
jgi:O-antigen/teichoic acid export membrane protein